MTTETHRARSKTPYADEAPTDEHSAKLLRIGIQHNFRDVKDYQPPSDSLYHATSERSDAEQMLQDLIAQRKLRESGEVDPEALAVQLNNPHVQSEWGAKNYRQTRAKRQGES